MANTIEETKKRAGWFIDRLVYGSQITQETHERTIKTLTNIDFFVKPMTLVSGVVAIHEYFFRFTKGNPPAPSKVVGLLGQTVLVGSLVGLFEISSLIEKYKQSAKQYQNLIKKAEQFKKDELESASLDKIETKLKELNQEKALIGLQCVSLTPSWKEVQKDIKLRQIPLLQPERIDVMKEIYRKFSEAEKKKRAQYFGDGSNLRLMLKNDKTVHYTTAEHAFWMTHASPFLTLMVPALFKAGLSPGGFFAGIAGAGALFAHWGYDLLAKSHLSAGSNMEKLWGESEIFLLSVDNKEGNPGALTAQLKLLKDEADALQTHSSELAYPWPFTKEIIQDIVTKKLPAPKKDTIKT